MIGASLYEKRLFERIISSDNMEAKAERNVWLDIIRAVAIIMIMFYHFYCRHSVLPTYNGMFSHGYLWVEMLFILSGFFILDSLKNADTFSVFVKKKLIRLTPALVICSLLTYFFLLLFETSNPYGESHSFYDFIVSIFYVSPDLVNKVFGTNVKYINGSYWFLWVEILFYIFAAIVYFINKKHFLRNFFIFSVLSFFIYYVIYRIAANCLTTNKLGLPFDTSVYKDMLSWCTIFHYFKFSVFFLIGILLRQLKSKKGKISLRNVLLSLIVAVMLFASKWWWRIDEMAFFVFFIAILVIILFVLTPNNIKLPKLFASLFTTLSVASYPMYLIHEQIGILLICAMATICGQAVFILPVVFIVLVVTLCCAGYTYIEKPIVNWLNKKVL